MRGWGLVATEAVVTPKFEEHLVARCRNEVYPRTNFPTLTIEDMRKSPVHAQDRVEEMPSLIHSYSPGKVESDFMVFSEVKEVIAPRDAHLYEPTIVPNMDNIVDCEIMRLWVVAFTWNPSSKFDHLSRLPCDSNIKS